MKSSILLTLLTIFISLTSQAEIINVNSKKELLNHTMPNGTTKDALIKISTEWCGPCQHIKEPYKKLAQQPEFSDILFVQVDGDTTDRELQKLKPEGVPTFVFMRGDNVLYTTHFGPNDFSDGSVAAMINKIFNRTAPSTQITEQNETIESEIKGQQSPSQPEKSQSFIKTIEHYMSSMWQHIKGFFLSIYNSIYSFFTCKQ